MSDVGWEIRLVDPDAPRRTWRAWLSGEDGRRTRLMVLVLLVLVGAGLADSLTGPPRTVRRPESTATASAAAATGSIVPSPGAQSSAWFCLGGSGTANGAQMILVLTNPTPRAVSGTISTVGPAGGVTSTAVTVPPVDQISLAPVQSAPGPWLGVTVLLDGGGVGVSEVVSAPLGWSTAPCASSTSSQWNLAHGSTASGASLSLLLFNPSSTDAVVDVSLDTSSEGVLAPPAYQGVPVPAGSLVSENVGDHVLNDPSIGTEVTASSGTVVAAELQSTPDGSGGGASTLLGVQAPSTGWEFPDTVDPTGGNVVFHVLNPSDEKVSVKVSVGLAQGQAEPLSLEVAPHSVGDLVAEQQTRIPTAAPYELSFLSSGAGVVVDREITAPPGSPAPQVGQVHGFPGGCSTLLVPAVTPSTNAALSLAISDASSRPVTVTVVTVAHDVAVPGLSGVVVRRDRPLVIAPTPGSPVGAGPIIVRSSGPVAVELDEGPVGAAGEVVIPSLCVP